MGEVSHDHSYWPKGVKSIDSKNPDYWQWGLNCKVLGFTTDQARACTEQYDDMTLEQRDMFWEGFVNGQIPA